MDSVTKITQAKHFEEQLGNSSPLPITHVSSKSNAKQYKIMSSLFCLCYRAARPNGVVSFDGNLGPETIVCTEAVLATN
jgi:hypothetical protein